MCYDRFTDFEAYGCVIAGCVTRIGDCCDGCLTSTWMSYKYDVCIMSDAYDVNVISMLTAPMLTTHTC